MILDLIGVPFEYLGRTREGADCLGLIPLAQAELGNHDVVDPWTELLEQSASTDWEEAAKFAGEDRVEFPESWQLVGSWPVAFRELRPGDVIEHDHKRALAHVSIVAEGGWILVTSKATGASYLRSWQDFCKQAGRTKPWRVWRITNKVAT